MSHWLKFMGALAALVVATAAQSATQAEMFARPGAIGVSACVAVSNATRSTSRGGKGGMDSAGQERTVSA